MLVLGFNGGTNLVHEDVFDLEAGASHDSAAVLLRDGEVVAAIEQERLDRIKHSNKLPVDAIRFCLKEGGARVEDLDAVAYYTTKQTMDLRLQQHALKLNLMRQTEPGAPRLLRVEDFVRDVFATHVGAAPPVERIHFVKHHVAHAVSAFAGSGYERALVLTIDGVGENESGRVAVAEGTAIETLSVIRPDLSLGHLYDYVIRFIGFKMFEEYKAMGLAPYGDPARFRKVLEQVYALLPNGEYVTSPRRLYQLFDKMTPRRKGEPFTQEHMDLAAALQEVLEAIVFHVLAHYQKLTGHTSLCLAGGVAHNCTMNGKIAASGMFERIFVQPAAHDAGCALGAALALHYQHRDRPAGGAGAAAVSVPGFPRLSDVGTRALRKIGGVAKKPEAPGSPSIADMPPPAIPLRGRAPRLTHLYFGTGVGERAEVAATLDRFRDLVEIEEVSGIEERAAALLAEGSVIGWVQGRSEFGPRALGNRSILADPRPEENKRIINAMVKKREGFRPFAPSVLEEDVRDYFVLKGMIDSPFMIFVVDVQEDKRKLLGAVTHVNGSARVQTVSKRTNPRYWALIDAFKAITGVPVVLNTSFNNDAEPIVDSVEDAVVSFLTTNLHYLVVGDHLVRKKDAQPAAYLALAPGLPRHVRLMEQRRFDRDGARMERAVLSNADKDFRRDLSADAYAVLRDADGEATLGALADRAGITGAERTEALVKEMTDLWSARAVTLLPR